MSKRLIFLMSCFFVMLSVISYATVTVNIEPNKDGVIDKSKIVNIVIKLTSDFVIDIGQIVIEWNGQDITQTLLKSAASQLNESKTEITFYYPISISDLQPGQNNISATTGNGTWYNSTLTIQGIDDQSLHFSYSSPQLSVVSMGSSQLKKAATTTDLSHIEQAASQTTTDKTKPKVNSMSASPSSLYLGQEVTISYKVTDNVALKQVELWVKEPESDWKNPSGKINFVSGTSSSNSFKHTPSKAGTTNYGLHVVDKAGNWNTEGSAGPKSVTVKINNSASYKKPLAPEYTNVKYLDRGNWNSDISPTTGKQHGTHRGVDIGGTNTTKIPNGTPVYSIAGGEVVYNYQPSDEWNALFIVRCPLANGDKYVYYGHILSLFKVGDSVDPGAKIGTVRLNHLHISVNSEKKTSNWGYNGTGEKESCDSIKSNGWERFQTIFNMPEYKGVTPVCP